jgi:hypothetical protein
VTHRRVRHVSFIIASSPARITGSLDPWVLTINGVTSFTAWVSRSVDQIGSEKRSGNRTHELDPYAQIDGGADVVWIQLSGNKLDSDDR